MNSIQKKIDMHPIFYFFKFILWVLTMSHNITYTLRSRTAKISDNEKKRLTTGKKTVNEKKFDNSTQVQSAKEKSII